MESLQKVKEILRRLRWRQERVGDITPGYYSEENEHHTCRKMCIKELMLDIFHFVCGEHGTNQMLFATSLEHQQERAQVCYKSILSYENARMIFFIPY